MYYKHTQIGYLIIILLLLISIAVFADINIIGEPPLISFSIFAIMIAVLVLFSTLTVTITREQLRLHFGVGLIYKKFNMIDILSVKPVRNKIWWGWGIRLAPHGWLYNVSGLDAVELTLKNGKKVRVGTDEPKTLVRAIQRAESI